jgi:hypothetical protein
LKAASDTLELRLLYEKNFDDWQTARHSYTYGKPLVRSGGWRDDNHCCIIFPAAVRIGYDGAVIWDELSSYVREKGLPNGYARDNPHGIEHLSVIPNTIQEMMLLSHENILRIFRVWPKDKVPCARFERLRAYGAFEVSAILENGTVEKAEILSLKGNPCSVESFSQNPKVFNDGAVVPYREKGEIITFETKPGGLYTVY